MVNMKMDGIFGSGITTAVKKFQSNKGLTVDENAGKGAVKQDCSFTLF